MRASTRVQPKPPSRPRKPSSRTASPAAAPARKAPRQIRSRATVDAIVDAAARVLRQDGYDGTTTNRVAEVAGVSVGSLYQYFPNKEALVRELLERHDRAMWTVFTDQSTCAIGRPFAEAVPAVIDALFAAHLVDPQLHQVLHQQIPRVGALALLHATSVRSRAVVEGLLQARTEEHQRGDDVPTAALVVVESVEALIHASIALPPAQANAVQRHASELVLGYLGVARPGT
ncbi:MAG: TetR/AcrR family transcriptional regulator [Kofleriaceae bacterium]